MGLNPIWPTIDSSPNIDISGNIKCDINPDKLVQIMTQLMTQHHKVNYFHAFRPKEIFKKR